MENPFRKNKQSRTEPLTEEELFSIDARISSRREASQALGRFAHAKDVIESRQREQARNSSVDNAVEQARRQENEAEKLRKINERVGTLIGRLEEADWFGATMVPIPRADGKVHKGPEREVPGWYLGAGRFGQGYYLTAEGMITKGTTGYFTVEELYKHDGGLDPLFAGTARIERNLDTFIETSAPRTEGDFSMSSRIFDFEKDADWGDEYPAREDSATSEYPPVRERPIDVTSVELPRVPTHPDPIYELPPVEVDPTPVSDFDDFDDAA